MTSPALSSPGTVPPAVMPGENLARVRLTALVVGVVALVVCAIGGWFQPAPFFRAYLVAFLFVLGLALGGMALVMVHHLTGGAWGIFLRRILEAEMKTLPLVAVLFLPVALALKYIFAWSVQGTPDVFHLRFRHTYLQPEFFWCRAVIYFVLWIGLALLLARWSRREDETGNVSLAWKSQGISGPGLVIYGISLHFATIDWIMSLESGFTSTMYGPLTAAGQLLSAFALAVLIGSQLLRRPEVNAAVSPKVLNDLGGLLFTLLIVWAYLLWFQFMLIWIADLRRDNTWNLARDAGVWRVVTWLIVLFHFVVPFFLLLLRRIKQSPSALAAVAALLLTMQLLFVNYQVLPVYRGPLAGGAPWMNFIMPLGLGGIWLACFLWLLERRPLVPLCDRNWPQAMHLRALDREEVSREEALRAEELAHG